MPSTSTPKTALQYLGLGLFAVALLVFTAMLGFDNYDFEADRFTNNFAAAESDTLYWQADAKAFHQAHLKIAGEETGLFTTSYASSFGAQSALTETFKIAQARVEEYYKTEGLPVAVNPDGTVKTNDAGVPDTVQMWQVTLQDWQLDDKLDTYLGAAANGPVSNNPWLFFLLTFGLAALGGLLYILPKFGKQPGIKHDHIYHSPLTRGLDLGWRSLFLSATVIGVLVYGYFYMDGKYVWPVATALVGALIIGLVLFAQNSFGRDARDAGPEGWSGWLGILAGTYFIGFYLLLYWAPQHILGWVTMVSPISEGLYEAVSGREGGVAGRWFLYGLMYTVIVTVMGVRMLAKYQHNKYQRIRTLSVMFFQFAFAFIIPEILVALNQPWYDFKNIWPLDYDFFHSWSVNGFIDNPGSLGMFMLFWGILLIIVGVPLMVHLVGKRWYCSWVCGCGGLAETLGDPWRQLSDKSLRAWKFERWIIHGVLLFAIVMTVATIYSWLPERDYWFNRSTFLIFFSVLLLGAMLLGLIAYRRNTIQISGVGLAIAFACGVVILAINGYTLGAGSDTYLFSSVGSTQKWYGFFIGAGFSGVVGTGFYPVMGNRVWCRFGCPLAAYLGLVQKFQSRFRITSNGGQCISCGNCSTYCEMGIDVRAYAQRGQDIVRSSCVGCGVCAAVCPRGVLRLENSSEDIYDRAEVERAIHVDGNTERALHLDAERGVTVL